MITTPIASNGSPQGTQSKNKNFNLKPEDFIKMMVTQLQNQDPTKPADNGQLLAQMSQIGQLQSSTTLTESIKGLVLQNQIGSAGNLIGKNVAGVDAQNNPINGVVGAAARQRQQPLAGERDRHRRRCRNQPRHHRHARRHRSLNLPVCELLK